MSVNEHEILLFRNLRAGGEQAFKVLYEIYVHPVMRICLFITRDTQLAKEVCIDTFMVLWDHRSEVSAMEKPWAWLYQTARNTAHNAVRSNRKRPEPADLSDHLLNLSALPSDVIEKLELIDFSHELNDAINQLPGQQRMVILLKLEGLNKRAIAKTLKISSATVKNHLAVAYKTLRESLKRIRDERRG